MCSVQVINYLKRGNIGKAMKDRRSDKKIHIYGHTAPKYKRSEEPGGRREERGGISEELHGSLLLADTPPYWMLVIDWTLQVIRLICGISLHSEDR